jgi:hypothetical protein
MAFNADLLHGLTKATAEEAWRTIVEKAIATTTPTLTVANASSEVAKRDREIGHLDHFLAASGWDLWRSFSPAVERNSDRLVRWWAEPYSAKAVLILDGLSLRELPWLLQGAEARGYTLHGTVAYGSELPGDTSQFARALGFNSRSQLQNNGGGQNHKLQTARTECVDMPWKDCAGLIDASQNWIFWHEWPDKKVHAEAGAGQGLDTLTRDVVAQLTSEDFWAFVERLSTGRRLVITSDHGYASSGHFADADGDVGQFLKKTFSSGRSASGTLDVGPFTPPMTMSVTNMHGSHLLALGRWKWKSQGGYPTLTHGGLSLLEVLCPFVELSK